MQCHNKFWKFPAGYVTIEKEKNVNSIMDIETIWLKISYFSLTHKDYLRKWWVILLIALDVFVFVFTFTNAILYVVGLTRQDSLMQSIANSPVDYDLQRQQLRPADLAVEPAVALPAGSGRLDLAAKVSNPNKQWAVSQIKYSLSVDGQPAGEGTDFIMPDSEKYLTVFGVKYDGRSASASVALTITEVNWQRVPSLERLAKIDFSISEPQYSSAISADNQTVHRVEAQAVNKSVDGFWKTRFLVALYNSKQLVAINYVYINEFRAGQTEDLFSQWEEVAGSVTGVSIIPDINLLDSGNVINP